MSNAPPLVLIVDDDSLVLATLALQLRAAGLEVMEAGDGEEAIRSCRSARPDVALVDLRLPGITGLEVIRRLRVDESVPGVLLTGADEPGVDAEALDAGALTVLRKPVDVTHLSGLLVDIVKRSRS